MTTEGPELSRDGRSDRAEFQGPTGFQAGDHNTQHNHFYSRGPETADTWRDPALLRAADDLAFAVKRQWEKEVALRRLNDPYPLPVRWQPAAPDVMEPWPSLVRLATTGVGRAWSASPSGWASGPEALLGGGRDLVEIFATVPTGRLVILGEPGSGKTMLMVRLVLDLLARRGPGEPVPVLAPLASWDPDRTGLDEWLEQRLGVDYPTLSEAGRSGTSRGKELLDAGLIVLALDGLDEMPARVHGRAIARINDALSLHPDLGLLLTSRSEQFGVAVQPSGGPEIRVTGAAGIELSPLDLGTVALYLQDSAGGPTNAASWGAVFSALTAESSPHPLAQLLTTPLMASLARVAYAPPPDEHRASVVRPVELLDRTRFPTPGAVRTHLLDSFIPAAYGLHPPPEESRRWTRRQADHFLTFLARDLEDRQHGTTDLRWWDLTDVAPKSLAGVAVGIAAVPAAVVMPFGAWLGVGMLVGVVVAMAARRWSPPGRSFIRGLAGGLVGSLLGCALGLGIRSMTGLGIPAGYVLSGLALGLVPGFLGGFRAGLAGSMAASFVGAFAGNPTMGEAAPLINSFGFAVTAACVTTLGKRRLPARGLRWSPLGIVTALGGGVAIGLAVVLQAGILNGVLSGAVTAAGCSFGAGLEAKPAEATIAADPQTALMQDRVTFSMTALAGGLAIGLAAAFVVGSVLGARKGIETGLADGLATGLAWGFLQAAYGSFALARGWLALRGHLPWRLMSFLEDAHRRGVLRQVGATYQLRHAELQRRLVGRR